MNRLTLTGGIIAAAFFTASATMASTLSATDSGWYRSDGVHFASNETTIVGQLGSEHRGFWVFDLSGVSGTATSATLRLNAGTIQSDTGTETLSFVEVSTAVATLTAGGVNNAAFADLGTGSVFATQDVLSSQSGSIIDIVLNSAALAAINASSGLFAVGAYSLTLNSATSFDYVFGGSPGRRELVLGFDAQIPLPAGLPLLAGGFGALWLLRRRQVRSHG